MLADFQVSKFRLRSFSKVATKLVTIDVFHNFKDYFEQTFLGDFYAQTKCNEGKSLVWPRFINHCVNI